MNSVISHDFLKVKLLTELCIKTGMQERGTERGEWGECYIPGSVAKHSGECPQAFRGMPSNIPENVLKHSGECPQTFWGMSPNIPENVVKHSREHSSNILHALSSQIQLMLAYTSILFQK